MRLYVRCDDDDCVCRRARRLYVVGCGAVRMYVRCDGVRVYVSARCMVYVVCMPGVCDGCRVGAGVYVCVCRWCDVQMYAYDV